MTLIFKKLKKKYGRCFQILWPFSQCLNFTPSRPFWKKNLATYRNKLERNMLGNSFFTFLPLTFVISILFLPSVLLLLRDLFWKTFFFAIYLNKLCAIVLTEFIFYVFHFSQTFVNSKVQRLVFCSLWNWKTHSLLQIQL